MLPGRRGADRGCDPPPLRSRRKHRGRGGRRRRVGRVADPPRLPVHVRFRGADFASSVAATYAKPIRAHWFRITRQDKETRRRSTRSSAAYNRPLARQGADSLMPAYPIVSSATTEIGTMPSSICWMTGQRHRRSFPARERRAGRVFRQTGHCCGWRRDRADRTLVPSTRLPLYPTTRPR